MLESVHYNAMRDITIPCTGFIIISYLCDPRDRYATARSVSTRIIYFYIPQEAQFMWRAVYSWKRADVRVMTVKVPVG